MVTRPVWYRPGVGAASFDTVEAGEALHHRAPDAWGTYILEHDGRLVHVFDTPVSTLPSGQGPP
nr:MAG TPA: hypothetical protein [Caudoviricetes sp.]